jgi:hypothetical protein
VSSVPYRDAKASQHTTFVTLKQLRTSFDTGARDRAPLPISAAWCRGLPSEAVFACCLADVPRLAFVSTGKDAVARVGRAANAD